MVEFKIEVALSLIPIQIRINYSQTNQVNLETRDSGIFLIMIMT